MGIAETLAELERDETPACPYCGMGGVQRKCNGAARWLCGCMVYNDTGVRSLRTVSCCEREITALREEIRQLQEHEKQTHTELGAVLGVDDSLLECAKRMRREIIALREENAALKAKNAELWTAVALAIGETDGEEDA